MEQTNSNELVVHSEEKPSILQQVQLADIDMLDAAESVPLDLMSDYWTPEQVGEKKKVIFDRIEMTHIPDQEGVAIELECAFFFVKENGQAKRIRNGSKRLVGALLNVPQHTALEIKYMGKKRNKNNSNFSDNWSVTPLRYATTAQ